MDMKLNFHPGQHTSEHPGVGTKVDFERSLKRYAKALSNLENALEPALEEILEVFLARDEVERDRNSEVESKGNAIAKLIELDIRLKAQSDKLAEYENLAEWQENLNIPAHHWWWNLNNSQNSLLKQAFNAYQNALSKVKQYSDRIPTEKLLDILLSRDRLEEILNEQKPERSKIAEIITLDEQLKALGVALTRDRRLEDWKHHLKPPNSSWWWDFTNPLPLLRQTIEQYEKAIATVETNQPPECPQLLEMLQARDAVEKAKKGNNVLPIEDIVTIIRLDNRLKKQANAIAVSKMLTEWKQSLEIPSSYWWWELTDPKPLPNQAIDRYEKALVKLEEPPQPSSAELLEVLLARDAVEVAESGQKQPPMERLAKIIALDDRLRKQAKVIADDNLLDEWKESLKPADNWWWRLTDERSPIEQALERYEKALLALEETRNPAWDLVLEVLLARDEVEEVDKTSAPEKSVRQIVELDRRLKKQRFVIARGNQLAAWRNSLKGEDANWWWHLKPTLVGGDDEPVSLFDWVWTAAAVGFLGAAAAFMTTTTQTFFQQVEGVPAADALQNGALIAQGAALLAGAGGALTKNGQKTIENVLASLRLPPQWNSRAAFGFSCLVFLGAYSINDNLPKLGKWYQYRGNHLVRQGELLQALENYRQASKFLETAEAEAELSLAVGKVYEQLGQLDKAQIEYEKGLEAENTESIIRLGRVILLQGLQQVNWTGKMESVEQLRQAEIYLELAWNRLRTLGENEADQISVPAQRQLLKEVSLNYGLLYWAQVDFESPYEEPENLLIQSEQASENPDPRVPYLVFRAYESFRRAAQYEENLPATADGGKAKCYLELAGYVQEKLNGQTRLYAHTPPYRACYNRLIAQPGYDLYDGALVWHTINSDIPAIKAEINESEEEENEDLAITQLPEPAQVQVQATESASE
ncbi:MAG: tetratricopeptide repeat protein [Oscillatoria sp. PMC 1051.18]|nr:tetratricopeptide repeat protein [Oscillatoria sp. PMC 1050.18]MEC5030051.1 tetratricopeptide repeat protein [Oscillatoria sp. PMC 1051.18]